jgi:hypothetical protein
VNREPVQKIDETAGRMCRDNNVEHNFSRKYERLGQINERWQHDASFGVMCETKNQKPETQQILNVVFSFVKGQQNLPFLSLCFSVPFLCRLMKRSMGEHERKARSFNKTSFFLQRVALVRTLHFSTELAGNF